MIWPVIGRDTKAKEEIKLTIKSTYDGTPIANQHFRIYEYGELNSAQAIDVDDDFYDFPVDYENMTPDNWEDMALIISSYAMRARIMPVCEGDTDENGVLTFTESEHGLGTAIYLVTGDDTDIGRTRYSCEPFFVSLPGTKNGQYVYEEEAYPKIQAIDLPEEETVQVVKLWDDTGKEDSRPDSVEVELLQDGTVVDTQTLSQDNNWRFTWNQLDADSSWTVVEKNVPTGYTVTLDKSNDTYTLTNKADTTTSEDPKNPEDTSTGKKLPQTGLNWLPPLTLFLAGTILVIVGMIRHKKGNHDEEK
jgi:hypothetical protein